MKLLATILLSVQLAWAPMPVGSAPDPTVNSAQGPLSANHTRTMLQKRWKSAFTDTAALARLEEIATQRPLIAGNRVTILHDGPQTMAAMLDAVRGAQNHINLETYIFDRDAVGIEFADALMERQRAGVQVQLIYDSIGTISTPSEFFERMRSAGIQLFEFNPVNPLTRFAPWEPNQRDHRKLLVVDGKVAFTGGVNISSTYANSSLFRSKARKSEDVGWRDTHVKIEGPAVAALQWEFLKNWDQQPLGDGGNSLYFPPLQPVGPHLIRVLASEPDGEPSNHQAYVLAITSAKTSIHITCAYFIPDPELLMALTAAAQRGVDVKLVLPGVKESGLAFYAGQSYFEDMLAAGIHIHQLQGSVLHAKTAVIDSIWSTIGSANMDSRSFVHNHELNIVVYDEVLGQAMEQAFHEDLRLSKEVSADAWRKRSAWDKVKEWAARRLEYWL
jgi:cardiolipin synthase